MMNAQIICVAAIGGIAISLLNLAEAHSLAPDKRPNLKDWLYWVSYPISALLGAIVAYVYVSSGFEIKPVLALHIGASTPLILRAMASAIPKEIKNTVVD